jgi:hypothetical protein
MCMFTSRGQGAVVGRCRRAKTRPSSTEAAHSGSPSTPRETNQRGRPTFPVEILPIDSFFPCLPVNCYVTRTAHLTSLRPSSHYRKLAAGCLKSNLPMSVEVLKSVGRRLMETETKPR